MMAAGLEAGATIQSAGCASRTGMGGGCTEAEGAAEMMAAVYARKSTDQSDMSAAAKSVSRQMEQAKAYAARNGWAVSEAHVYVDDGISGAEFAARPGFVRLMNALKPRPGFGVLIMSEESRLGREQIETSYALKQILQAGVRVFYYLEDRERTLGSPTDKLLLSVTAFADELEREKARQRTYDAVSRLARAGHVAGGKCFGYDNVPIVGPDGQRSHVERRINEAEAAVVRRIFELMIAGNGQSRIAKILNAEGAVAPRSQQGRPRAWAPSSVHEVLFRSLYRGEVVWNRTRKRDTWGRHRSAPRPEAEWMRRLAPDLRIVSDELWQAAHGRLDAKRGRYLHATNGQRWGRPKDNDSKYLLPGFARCDVCGGGLHVRSRSHGQRRAYFYACTSYHQRGPSVCANGTEGRMDVIDRAVLQTIAGDLLTPAAITRAVGLVCEAYSAPQQGDEIARLRAEATTLEGQSDRLADAIATGGSVPILLGKLEAKQVRLNAVRAELLELQGRQSARVDLEALELDLRGRLADWRRVLLTSVPEARNLLRKLLDGPIRFTPKTVSGRDGYEFRGKLAIGPIVAGLADLPM